MIYSRSVIVDKMKSWLGCKEGDATHKLIIDTYNSHKPLARGYKVKYTDAWCATTVSAAAVACGYTAIIPTECSCNKMISLLQQKGIWQENDAYIPRPGDIIFYDWQDTGAGDNKGTSEHVGLVEACDGSTITVIEGNKNDGVERRTVKVNGRYIRGYGVPKYDNESVTKQYSYGIDISACQSAVDFYRVKNAGIDFVILRSTIKSGLPDAKFERYYADAQKAGLKVAGVYKYSYAINVQQAYAEAVSVVKLLNGRNVPIWYDLEDASQIGAGKHKIAQIAEAFLQYCQVSGYEAGIYCNVNWYNNYIDKSLKQKYKFWIARYGKNDGTLKEQYKPNIGEVMWQYTSKGKVDGIPGYVDMDVKC